MPSDPIATPPARAERLRSLLGPTTPWREVQWLASTGSTNADLAALARTGDGTGTVLVSDEQSAGRGRFARRWESPAGSSVALSALLRPRRPAHEWGWLSLLCGMAVATGIERATGAAPGRVELKWPNDVLVDGRKVCGILSERVEGHDGMPAAAVLGIGINLAIGPDELPVPTATSLRIAGLEAEPEAVVAAVLTELARLEQRWEDAGQVRQDYAARCSSIGAPLRVMVDEQTQVLGTGNGVDEFGRLLVRTSSGVQAFSAGDVFHLRLQG